MNKRWILFFLIFTTAYFTLVVPLGRKRQQEIAEQQAGETPVEQVDSSTGAPPARDTETPSPDTPEPAREVRLEEAPTEVVETELARVEISHRGALPVSWQLLPSAHVATVFEDDHETTEVIELVPQVSNRESRELPLQLEGRTVSDFNSVLFDAERSIEDGKNVLTFRSPVINGVQMVKTYTFEPDSYLARLKIDILNGEMRTTVGDDVDGWGLGWQGGFMNPESIRRVGSSRLTRAGGAIADEVRLKDLDSDDKPLEYESEVHWGGVEKKYFMAMLVPGEGTKPNRLEVAVRRRNLSEEYQRKGVAPPIGAVLSHPQVQVQPNESVSLDYWLIVAPKDYNVLKEISEKIGMTGMPMLSDVPFDRIPLGQHWLRPISLFLLTGLRYFAGHLHNWGLAIIVLVLIVKIVLYPLSHWAIKNQAKTMAEQAKLKPYLEKINEKYKDDPTRKSQEMMKLYREHNINPFGMLRGCFPILLQTPIFFALYVLLDQAVELRGQSFLWIDDLTRPDRLIPFGFALPILGWDALNILPLLMALTQYFTSKLMTYNITDPMQRQMMVMMPIFFVFILYNMPSGLMLYWTVQNVWQIGHTVLTKRYVARHDQSPGGKAAPTAAAG